MDSEIHSFSIGDFQCIAVSDGTHVYAPPDFPPPAGLLFANASGAELETALAGHGLHPEQWMEWESPYICLVIDTGDELVLVDTGAGDLSPHTGKLISCLETAGIAPGDVDTVLLTHGHPDHIGGNMDKEGNPVFRNARHIVFKEEWDFWTTDRAAGTLDEHSSEILMKTARENLPPLEGRLELIDGTTEILPGIFAIAMPGHTPGHMVVDIISGQQRLLCVADAVLHPLHLEHPEWFSIFDVLPEQVVASRQRLLDIAATAKIPVLAFHFPFPGLGRVVPKDNAWQWQPVE